MAKLHNIQSKYLAHYLRLIEKAKSRGKIDGYFETHHIIPRCLGGTDSQDNLVRLTAREHFVAHRLLAHAYRGRKEAKQLWAAVWFMAGLTRTQKKHWKRKYWKDVRVCSRTYEIARLIAFSGEHPAAKPMKDHRGQKFKSQNEMVRHWGIRKDTYMARRKRGWSRKDALETPNSEPGFRGFVVRDHLDQKYDSQGAMCDHWGIPRSLFCSRTIKQGWSLKKALTTKPKKRLKHVDHEGSTFATQKEMARHWGLSRSAYKDRRKRGWSKKRALETGPGEVSQGAGEPCKDHKGGRFKSVADMSRHWGIGPATVSKRIKAGWDLKSALTVKPSKGNNRLRLFDKA